MNYDVILFDFDGTLADSAKASLAALQSVAPEFGFSPIRDEEISRLRQHTARELITKRLGIPLWRIWTMRRLERRVREEFQKRAGEIRLFPGIAAMLTKLRAHGYRIGIVTSNTESVVQQVLERERAAVDYIHAGSRFLGKAHAIRIALAHFRTDRRNILYIGDELRDVEACKKIAVEMIGVGWGFNAPEALQKSGARVVSTPEEILRMLGAH